MADTQPGVAIIGAGAVGRALALRLAECGYPIDALLSRSAAPVKALAVAVEPAIVSTSIGDLPPSARLVFCCVPDDAVGTVARALAAARADWSGCTVAHTSGALPAVALEPLDARGAALLSFHPLQTFTLTSPPSAFQGIYVGLEGDAEAVALGEQVVADLGARAVALAPDAKTRYHLAASMASNFFVTLMALATEVLESAGIDAKEGAAMLRPLVAGTWTNLRRQLPEDALTGPIVRGDRSTLRNHLEALAKHQPGFLPVYAALAAETVRLAVRSGRLAQDDAQHLLDLLHDALEPDRDLLF